jgi:hypothetical protein
MHQARAIVWEGEMELESQGPVTMSLGFPCRLLSTRAAMRGLHPSLDTVAMELLGQQPRGPRQQVPNDLP